MEAPRRRECLQAIDRLAEKACPAESDIAFLLDFLGDPDKPVQRRAAEELARLARLDAGMIARLTTALVDAQPALRWGAAYTLGLIGPPPLVALPTLREMLGHEDADLRWAAATLLQRTQGPIADELVKIATSGGPAQRKMALYCLRDLRVDSPSAEQVMLAALADGEAGVRLAALSALSRAAVDRANAARRIGALVDDPDNGVRRAAVAALGGLGYRSAEVFGLLRRAAAHPSDAGLRRAALRAMRQLSISPAESLRPGYRNVAR